MFSAIREVLSCYLKQQVVLIIYIFYGLER